MVNSMRYMLILTIFIGIIILVFWLLRKMWNRYKDHHITFADKAKLAFFTYSIWVIICSLIIFGLSTSTLGWQVLSIWLVKGILALSIVLTFLTYTSLHRRKF